MGSRRRKFAHQTISNNSIRDRLSSSAESEAHVLRFSGRVRSVQIHSRACAMRSTAYTLPVDDRRSGHRGFMYAPKIAWLSRIGMSCGRFLWRTLVPTDAANPFQHATSAIRRATLPRISRDVCSSGRSAQRFKIEVSSAILHAFEGGWPNPRVDEDRDCQVLGHELIWIRGRPPVQIPESVVGSVLEEQLVRVGQTAFQLATADDQIDSHDRALQQSPTGCDAH